jgi:molybdate transport system regulatory protein
MTKAAQLRLRTRIWVEDEAGNMVFGLGRVKILESIHRTGSINAAAKELKMSYKAVWERLKVTEERLGAELVIRRKGGASGGSSYLSDFAHQLLAGFQELHQSVLSCDDQQFEEILKPILNAAASSCKPGEAG